MAKSGEGMAAWVKWAIGLAITLAVVTAGGLIGWGKSQATSDDHERRITHVETKALDKKLDKDPYYRDLLKAEKQRQEDLAIIKKNQENIQNLHQGMTQAVEKIGGELKVINFRLKQIQHNGGR